MNKINQYQYPLTEIHISSEKAFHTFYKALSLSTETYFLFRGHAKTEWNLSPSLDRYKFKNQNDNSPKIWLKHVFEFDILDKIQKRLPNYVVDIKIPDIESYSEWIALIQHYGGFTRLLDFTESFNVALFFAINEKFNPGYKKSVIWGINWYNEEIDGFGYRNKYTDFYGKLFNEIIKNDKDKLYYPNMKSKKRENLIFKLETQTINKRMDAQRGLFLYGYNSENTFEGNLFNCSTEEVENIKNNPYKLIINKHSQKFIENIINTLNQSKVIKMVFPDKLNEFLRKWLIQTDTTWIRLFPDIEGVMKFYF